MKDIIKWLLIALVSMFMLAVAVLLVAPNFIDINRYKSAIEREITLSIGRPCTIDGKISLSFVPSLGLHFSGFHIGNSPGFSGKDFIYIKSFDTRIEFLPLFSKEFKIRHIVLDGVRIIFEKRKDGVKNWSGLCMPEKGYKPACNINDRRRINAILEYCIPMSYLDVNNFTVTNASLFFIDHSSETNRSISDVDINISGISFDHPMDVDISATVGSCPVHINGTVGPVARKTVNGSFPLSLTVRAFSVLTARVTGKISNPCYHPSFDFQVAIPPFSPKTLARVIGFEIRTGDPDALNNLSLKATARAKDKKIYILNGDMVIDSANLNFSGLLKGLGMSYISFEVGIDHLDLDHYLPVSLVSCSGKESCGRLTGQGLKSHGAVSDSRTDERPATVLRAVSGKKACNGSSLLPLFSTVPLKGVFAVKDMKVYGVRLKNISVKVYGNKGTFRFKPISFDMYDGHAEADAAFYLARRIPINVVNLHVKGVRTGPLLKDITGKNIMEGRADCDLFLKAYGRTVQNIRRRIYGKGKFLLSGGSVIGIDIKRIIRHTDIPVDSTKKNMADGKTEFSGFSSVFTIRRGVLHTEDTKIVFPDIVINLTGDADMVNKDLNLRLTAICGGHPGKNKTGLMITNPVLITGTFSSPRLSLDIANDLEKGIKKAFRDKNRINKVFDRGIDKKKRKKLLNNIVKDLFRGLISK